MKTVQIKKQQDVRINDADIVAKQIGFLRHHMFT